MQPATPTFVSRELAPRPLEDQPITNMEVPPELVLSLFASVISTGFNAVVRAIKVILNAPIFLLRHVIFSRSNFIA